MQSIIYLNNRIVNSHGKFYKEYKITKNDCKNAAIIQMNEKLNST